MTDDFSRMNSHRPYLLRALVEWINDNAMTPHILVDAAFVGVQVPSTAIKDGRVVLNIAQRAVQQLQIDNAAVRFTARFAGASFPVTVPIAAVLAVYARETGQGMALPEDILNPPPASQGADLPASAHSTDDPPPPSDDGGNTPSPGRRPHLRLIK